MFLDYNKIDITDEEEWFKNVFICGPGFQMVQIFLENVYEKHVDWIRLIQDDDNYKNILQVKIQKEFKVTPHYIEISENNQDIGYHMGVYLCLGQSIHGLTISEAMPYTQFASFSEIHQYMSLNKRIFLFLGEGNHKIKKKAEQICCSEALDHISTF
jgi:dsRNA-specific ribonuclease